MASFTLACIFLPFEFVKSTSINLHSHLQYYPDHFRRLHLRRLVLHARFHFWSWAAQPENMKNLLVTLKILKSRGTVRGGVGRKEKALAVTASCRRQLASFAIVWATSYCRTMSLLHPESHSRGALAPDPQLLPTCCSHSRCWLHYLHFTSCLALGRLPRSGGTKRRGTSPFKRV